ncbi:MAG: aspartate carbamoyltransferase catalytic subunit [Ruminococcaceae bacterium]|nr:aspartate carbamoyltransferase catalytic subunit [Oscillospiraceae bacterium]
MGKNLLKLSDLSTDEIIAILDRAQMFCAGVDVPVLSDKIACNMFFESSTRTQYSFNVAELRLGMRVVSFNPGSSSMNKNESFYDTVKCFDSFGPDAIVIRHVQNEYYNELLGHINAALLNGGDGTGNHPTQSLLDLLTIKQEFGRFEGLKCVIAGDISHSRVAHTNYEVMRRLGMEVVTAGPEEFLEKSLEQEDFDHAVKTSDIVMMLRVQHERHAEHMKLTKEEYHQAYGLTVEREKTMKDKAIIMHPAPVNRDVELADCLMECPRARIFKQMQNGVFVRMAALERAVK